MGSRHLPNATLARISPQTAAALIRVHGGETTRKWNRNPCKVYRVLCVDGAPWGMWGLSRPGQFAVPGAYMGWDCAFQDAPDKAASLVAASVLSVQARYVAERLHRRRVETVHTTAMSLHPDAMKYRYWWARQHAEQQANGLYRIVYEGVYQGKGLDDILAEWIARGGSAEPARPIHGEGTVGIRSLRSILQGEGTP